MTLRTVYYLVHGHSKERIQWYRTRTGARIAQRTRNRLLGFIQRIDRREIKDNWEIELCRLSDGSITEATYCVVEDLLEQEDF